MLFIYYFFSVQLWNTILVCTDYYNHCVDVANTLISFGIKDEDVICAALLHDIIEDVEGYREITIAKMFNPNVARLVMLVTKKEGVNYKHPEAIKEYLQNISTDMNAAAIKASDRMHNMLTLDEKTFEARYRKAIETKTYYERCPSGRNAGETSK